MQEEKAYAVITGASSGIGLEFSKVFARLGFSVLLIARREDRLKQITEKLHEHYGVTAEYYVADLSDTKALAELCRRLKKIRIRFFINNAGFGACGEFDKIPFRTDLTMMDTNVRAVHVLTKFMVKYYEAHHIDGYILNTASSAGLVPGGPYMASYYATKAYVRSLTESVAEELREKGSGIYLGCLCPGPVRTEFNRVASVEFATSGISAAYCVRAAMSGMLRGKVVIVPERYMRLLVAASKFAPDRLVLKLTGSQQKKKLEKNPRQ